MQPDTTTKIGDYTIRFNGVDQKQVENFAAEIGNFTVSASGNADRHLTPERRVYEASGTPTTEAAIETYGFSQLYLQLGEVGADGSRVVRAWYKPYVTLIWLGAIVMAFAGFLSLTDRKLRVGAPRRAAVPKPAPAE
jgi:cytochrome c-type biogenesis protein CcmF